MLPYRVPALPLELKDIGRLASDALAANTHNDDSNSCKLFCTVPEEHLLIGPTVADWVSINDNLLGLSKDFLLRVNNSLSINGRRIGAPTVLLHALSQRLLAAVSPQVAYDLSHFLTAARSFISAMELRQAMDYYLNSSGSIRTLSTGATLATTLPDESNTRKVSSYWLSVDEVKTTTRRHGNRVVCDVLSRFAYMTSLGEGSFIIVVDKIEDLSNNSGLIPLGTNNIFACGNLKKAHFVIFMTDLIDNQELLTVNWSDYDDAFSRVSISHSSLYDLIRSRYSDRIHSRLHFSKEDAERFALARAAVEQRSNASSSVAKLFFQFDTPCVETEDRICFHAKACSNSNVKSTSNERSSGCQHTSHFDEAFSKFSDDVDKHNAGTSDSDMFDDLDAPMSFSRMARAFFGYKGLRRGYGPH
jgi:hypothetical protein